MLLSIKVDSITTYSNEEEFVTILPKDGESWNAKNGEKDDEKLPIIIDDGTEIDDIINGNVNLW